METSQRPPSPTPSSSSSTTPTKKHHQHPSSSSSQQHRIDSFHRSIRLQSLDAAPEIISAMASTKNKTPAAPSKTYDVLLRLHSFTNVPIADLNTLSADPYIVLKVKVPTAPHDTPSIRFRTPTYHRNRAPEFDADCFWIVSGVPPQGFGLKIKAYDEDPMNKDDGLGSRKIQYQGISEGWKKENIEVDLKRLHNGSLRAFGCAGLLKKCSKDGSVTQHRGRKSGRPVVCMSLCVIGETQNDTSARQGECYTSGPAYFSKHFSPLVGRVTGIVSQPDPPSDSDDDEKNNDTKKPKYNFQANEMQLPGPVPPELNHQFVPSKWLIKQWFKGILLPHVLHMHHRRIFSHDNLTVYGVIVPESQRKRLPDSINDALRDDPKVILPSSSSSDHKDEIQKERKNTKSDTTETRAKEENATADPHKPARSGGKKPPFLKATAPLNITRRFLEMCGMIDENGVVLTQQHHHKDKSKRSLSPLRQKQSKEQRESYIGQGTLFTYIITLDGRLRWSEVGMGFLKEAGSKHVILANGAKHVAMSGEFFIQSPSTPDGKFRLVIDNDSGTYRPPEKVLKTFKSFLERVFGDELEVMVLHCWGDDGEKLSKMKEEHLKGEDKRKDYKKEEDEQDDDDGGQGSSKSKASTPEKEDGGKEHLEVPEEETGEKS